MAATADISTDKATFERVAEFLGPKAWHDSAPRKLIEAMTSDDVDGAWEKWTLHLQKRKAPAPLHESLMDKNSPLLWSLPSAAAEGHFADLAGTLQKVVRGREKASSEAAEQLPAWLTEAEDAEVDATYALECLAWAYALPNLAGHAPAEVWCELVEHLLSVCRGGSTLDGEVDPLVTQLISGELPLALAYHFPELKVCRKLRKGASAALSGSLEAMLDGEGLPHGRYLQILRPLLACWTRCRAIGESLKNGCWNDSTESQYQWFVTSALRLTRFDGSQVLASGVEGEWSPALFSVALDLGGDEADLEVADVALPGRKAKGDSEFEWPEPANNSEWSCLSTLRSELSRKGNHVTVNYSDGCVQSELNVGRDTLISGEWAFEVRVDGKLVAPAADAEWDEVCWESDEDVDYLELELNLTDDLRLQRSFLLARDDQFLIVADAVISSQSGEIQYRGLLPLSSRMNATGSKEHTEVSLGVDDPHYRVLPLGISEWKSDSHLGSLEVIDGSLELTQRARGSSLYAPLFFDLSRRRRKMPLTWRQLSVGEERKVLTSDVAVGYRIEIGKAQWVCYRSLAPTSNRTFLGQNLISEILVGRFDSNGDVEKLLEIE